MAFPTFSSLRNGGLGWLDQRVSAAFADMQGVDFASPPGEPGLASPDSISWIVFRNPVSLFIGGVAAVLLELAEPRVRSGVWDHTTFREDPLGRMRRTGLAAMVTIYAARSVSGPMIASVRRRHDRVRGTTPDGVAYHANDPELLRWVQATALFGFLEAYSRFVRPLEESERDRFYAEGRPAGEGYGATLMPVTHAGMEKLFQEMLPLLEPSEIVFEFLDILKRSPVLPTPLNRCHHMLMRAAVAILPGEVRERLGLGTRWRLGAMEEAFIRRMARIVDQLDMRSCPAARASVRMGLPDDHLRHRLIPMDAGQRGKGV